MELTFQKTLTFILFIFIGLLLKVKFKTGAEVTGIKKIILNLALPATIFIALLGIEVESNLLLLPFLALFLNALLFFAFPCIMPFLGIKKNTSNYRTARLLIPSLAPGLSCFPFVLEFLGEPYLAKAAMADLGNKVFVLIALYIIAMNWHYHLQAGKERSKGSKIKDLLWAMISEPVNIFIAVALSLVSFGINMETLPFFMSEMLSRLSLLMTPLVLLFIGLAVKIKRTQFGEILSILLLRAGVVVLISAIFVGFSGIVVQADILLLLAFGLSACSFWPFAHIAAVESQEKNVALKDKTFNGNYAVSMLALSFPFSTILILGILSSGNIFNGIIPLLALSFSLIILGCLPMLIARLKTIESKTTENNPVEKISNIEEGHYEVAASED